MIDEKARRAVDDARWNDGRWVTPLYDSYCFSAIPRLIRALLTSDKPDSMRTTLLGPAGDASYEAVVLFFVDAFGWRFYEQYADHGPLLERIGRDGRAVKLTT